MKEVIQLTRCSRSSRNLRLSSFDFRLTSSSSSHSDSTCAVNSCTFSAQQKKTINDCAASTVYLEHLRFIVSLTSLKRASRSYTLRFSCVTSRRARASSYSRFCRSASPRSSCERSFVASLSNRETCRKHTHAIGDKNIQDKLPKMCMWNLLRCSGHSIEPLALRRVEFLPKRSNSV